MFLYTYTVHFSSSKFLIDPSQFKLFYLRVKRENVRRYDTPYIYGISIGNKGRDFNLSKFKFLVGYKLKLP